MDQPGSSLPFLTPLSPQCHPGRAGGSRCTPRNLKEDTLSTQMPSIFSGVGSTLFRGLLSSPSNFSLVLLVFGSRLFVDHQATSHQTSSLYAVSSPSEMRPTNVVSLANFTMMLESYMGTQSCLYNVNRKGLSTQP